MLAHPKCPRCRETELAPVRAGATTLDRCSQCQGLWFDAKGDELEQVLKSGWERVPEALKQAGPDRDPNRDTPADQYKLVPLLCPRCGSDMITYWYGGEATRTFLVDACPLGHGVWLDSGELEKAFQALKEFTRTRAAMERSGRVDEALARAEPGDWGPKSVFGNPFWEYLASFLKMEVRRPGPF
jgi:Zn-finger nucleic acid-binding protein